MQAYGRSDDCFTVESWRSQCNEALLKSSDAVDELCKALGRNQVRLPPMSNVALTVAVLERSIWSYVRKVRKKQSTWKHSGAVLSLLEMMNVSMQRVQKLVEGLSNEISLIDYMSKRRFVVAGVSGLGLYFGLRWTKNWFMALGFVLGMIHSMKFLNLRYLQRRLRVEHEMLSTILRLWYICIYEMSGNSRKGVIPISRWMLDLVGIADIWYSYIRETNPDLGFLWYTYSILYSSVVVWYKACARSIPLYGFPVGFFASIYYALRPSAATARTSKLLSAIYSPKRESTSTNLRLLRTAWKQCDQRIAKLRQLFSNFWIFNIIGSPRFRPLRWTAFYCVTVLGMYPCNLQRRIPTQVRGSELLTLQCSHSLIECKTKESSVILFLHAGGWAANFLNSDLSFTNDWIKKVQDLTPILTFDYSLKNSPTFSLRKALTMAKRIFLWICDSGLGFSPKRIIIAGDSVGARLAVSLTLDLILSESMFRPDGLLLAYPLLGVSMTGSASRSIFMIDPIAPLSLLNEHGEWAADYDDKNKQFTPFSSVLQAPDEIIKQLPEISILVGGMDPFLDDSIDFAHLLVANDVKCRLQVFRNLPHGFLSFRTMLPAVELGINLSAQWLQDSIDA